MEFISFLCSKNSCHYLNQSLLTFFRENWAILRWYWIDGRKFDTYLDDVVLITNFRQDFVLTLNWWYKTALKKIVLILMGGPQGISTTPDTDPTRFPLTAVTCSTASIIRTNSLGQCLKCGTISLGQGLIYLDKLVRSVGLCLKFKLPCENVRFF